MPSHVKRGVALIVAAALTISIQDVVFKIFSSQMTLWQIFALRGVIAVPLLMGVLWVRGTGRGAIGTAFELWPMVRALCITLTLLAFYAAIPFVSLSTVGAANYIAPIFVALLSAYVVKEPVGLLGWLAVVSGFAGVLLLLQPGTDAFSPWVLLPVAGAAFYAVAHIVTRAKCQDAPLAALSLSQNVAMMAAGFLVSVGLLWLAPRGDFVADYPYLFGQWAPVGAWELIFLGVLAGLTILASLLLAGAYQAAPPATVATFEYTYLPFVILWDVVFFSILPTFTSMSGIILILAAGLLVLRRG